MPCWSPAVPSPSPFSFLFLIAFCSGHTWPHVPCHTSGLAQSVKYLPAMHEIQVQSLGQPDLEREMATHSSILAWMNGESHGQRAWQATVHGVTSVGHNLVTKPPPRYLQKSGTLFFSVSSSSIRQPYSSKRSFWNKIFQHVCVSLCLFFSLSLSVYLYSVSLLCILLHSVSSTLSLVGPELEINWHRLNSLCFI